jgi:hypothetical protein
MVNLFWAVGNRPELLPDLATYCKKDSSKNREHALAVLARILPPKDLPSYWTELLADSDSSRRRQAIEKIVRIDSVDVRLTILAAGFESPDPSVRQDMRQCLPGLFNAFRYGGSADGVLVKRLVQRLLPFLDDSAPSIRRAAAQSFLWLLGENGLLWNEYAFSTELWDTAPGTPRELEMVETIRAAVRKWLESHR